MAIRIEQVDAGSEAEALGLAPGDELLSVDDNELNDTLDYDFYTDSSSFHLKARVADGIREWEVQRPQRGPFGCGFKTYLGDAKHSCSNHCMFCFIDQLPPGMRESLYFKDDDERLSFLFGNYITRSTASSRCTSRRSTSRCTPPTPSCGCVCWPISAAARCLSTCPVWWRAALLSTASWCSAAA